MRYELPIFLIVPQFRGSNSKRIACAFQRRISGDIQSKFFSFQCENDEKHREFIVSIKNICMNVFAMCAFFEISGKSETA